MDDVKALRAAWDEAVYNARENWTVSPREHIERLITAGDALIAALAAPRPSGGREAPDLVALHRRLYDAAMREKRTLAEMVIRPDIEEKALAHDEAEMDRIAAYLDLLAWRPSPPGERPEIRVGDVVSTERGRVFRVEAVQPVNADFAPEGAKRSYRGEDGGSALDVAIVAIYRDPLWRKP